MSCKYVRCEVHRASANRTRTDSESAGLQSYIVPDSIHVDTAVFQRQRLVIAIIVDLLVTTSGPPALVVVVVGGGATLGWPGSVVAARQAMPGAR